MYLNKILFILVTVLCAASPHQNVDALSSAVAVPCYYKHFKYLPGLLKSLTEQTHLPEEVVISLSQVEYLTEGEIDALESGPWPFAVKILRKQGIFMEGANRTAAARECHADLVLCIDADDIPHPQRIEAVVQLFETVPDAAMVLCGHAYCPGESIICEPAIPLFSSEEYGQLHFELGPASWLKLNHPSELTRWESGVHNGSPSLRRSVLEQNIYWSDLKNGADLAFNREIFGSNHPVYLIQLPLLHYFNGRSSGTDIGR